MAPDRPAALGFDFAAIRAAAEHFRALAAADGGATDRQAEAPLALLAEIDRLRAALTALGGIVCPRCEGQSYDVEACGVCQNMGWLDGKGEALDAS